MALLRIGIVVSDGLTLNAYRQVVALAHGQVAITLAGANAKLETILAADVDAWLVNLDSGGDLADAELDALEQVLHDLPMPVVFVSGAVPAPTSDDFKSWSRRLQNKISQLAGSINLKQVPAPRLDIVWVLAASTGGPEAVIEFLQPLQPSQRIAFIYVQHIEASFEKNLVQAINRRTTLRASVAQHGDVLQGGQVVLVPAHEQMDLLPNGTFQRTGTHWRGAYSPSADQVIANVGNVYGSQSGVIVFSGMGDDGACGCRWLQQKGGKVWAQTPDSCTVSAMVDAVADSVTLDYTGLPAAMGQRFKQMFATPIRQHAVHY